jgi:hypothetical protein
VLNITGNVIGGIGGRGRPLECFPPVPWAAAVAITAAAVSSAADAVRNGNGVMGGVEGVRGE